jgi:hypothetical protein
MTMRHRNGLAGRRARTGFAPRRGCERTSGHRNRGATGFEDEYWTTEGRTGTAARDNEREPLFLIRDQSGWHMPRPGDSSMGAPQRGFDTERPSWLSRRDFTPVDTSQPMLAGPEYADVDVTRPERWMNDDGEFSPGVPSRLSLITAMMGSLLRRVTRRVTRATVASPAIR